MSRALVLGGGGPVGAAWEAGLIVGLAGAGVVLGDADAIVGTSAGAVVGAQLAAGADLGVVAELLGAAITGTDGGSRPGALDNHTAVANFQNVLVITAEAAAGAGDTAPGAGDTAPGVLPAAGIAAPAASSGNPTLARIGRMALEASTIAEEDYLGLFASLRGVEWPERFSCSAVDTASGAFVMWGAASGVELVRAVAASCAVPTVFPAVTIDGARYMDGGMRDILNADVAAGHRSVVAVSCTLLELPAGLAVPTVAALLAATAARLDALRHGGAAVEVIVPGAEFLGISGWGLNLMDFTRVHSAYEAGLRQGQVEATRLAPTWGAA